MLKPNRCICITLLAMALVLSCAGPVPLIRSHIATLAEKDELVIVMYGDELSGGDTSFDRANSWAGMLKPRFVELFGKRISFINSSRMYESFQTAQRRMEEDILSYRPDIVLVMLGRVDAFSMDMPLRTHESNVEEFLGELKKRNKFVVLITSPGLMSFPAADDETLDMFDRFIQTTSDGARMYRFPVIDVAGRMERLLRRDPVRYMSLFADNSTLNLEGKEYVGDIVFEYFQEAVTTP